MIALTTLIDQLDTLQVRWSADNGRLHVSAPDGVLTADLVALIRAHKPALLKHADRTIDQLDGPQPLSFAQERLWFLETLGSIGPAYNVAGAVRIGGALHTEPLAAAFEDVQRRHDVLRARFVDVDGLDMQVSSAEVAVLQQAHWHGDATAAIAAAVAEAQQTFDISADTLIRATLHEISATDHVLAVTMPHLVSDGGSLGVLIADLTEAYQTRVHGEAPRWAALPFQYADFAREQRASVERSGARRDVEYWRERLEDAPDAITLPTDHGRPPVLTFAGASVPVRLQASIVDQVTRVAQRCDGTPFMVLLSVYAIVLGRLAGQQDVVVGIPVSGRPHDGDGLMGLFVNALPIQITTTPRQSFTDLVMQVRNSVVDAMAHAQIPWEFLVEALAPTRALDHAPVFQVSFTLQPDPVASATSLGLTLEDVPIPIRAAKFELSLELQVSADGEHVGVLEYNTDLFDEATARRCVSLFVQVVELAVAAPEEELGTLARLLPAEEAFLAEAWQGPAVPFDCEGSLVDAFVAVVRRWPARVAIASSGSELTFAEVDRRRCCVATALRRQGVEPGTCVGVLVDRSAETIINLLGVLSAGAAYVPIDPSWPEERRRAVQSLAECVVVIDNCLSGETAEEAGGPDFSVAPTPGSVAYVLFTSGSTGEPKGVVVEHGSIRHLIEALEYSVYQPLDIADYARVTVNGALTFDTSVKQVFQLLQGRTLVLVPEHVRLDGEALLEYAVEMGVQVLDATPSQLAWLVEAGLTEAPGSLRAVLAGGEA